MNVTSVFGDCFKELYEVWSFATWSFATWSFATWSFNYISGCNKEVDCSLRRKPVNFFSAHCGGKWGSFNYFNFSGNHIRAAVSLGLLSKLPAVYQFFYENLPNHHTGGGN
jgi:hypothetical protein